MNKVLLFLGISFLMGIKNDPVKDLALKTQDYFQQRPMEKVYLHLSQPYFTNGDYIWFKAYVLDYRANRPTQLSEVLHIDLIDPNGAKIKQTMIEVFKGLGSGSIKLEDDLKTGNYQLVAYTNWMKNFDSKVYYNNTIEVISSIEMNQEDNLVEENSAELDIPFFIEGQHLIHRKESNILIKAKPKSSIYLIRNSLDTIQKVESDITGFTVLNFVPYTNDNYTIYTDSFNPTDLPQAMSKGTSLKLTYSEKGEFKLIASCSDDFDNKPVHFSVQSNGTVLFSLFGRFSKNKFSTTLYQSDLPPGLLHLTLIDHNGEVRNERFIFNEPQEEIALRLNIEQEIKAKNKVKLEIQLTDTLSELSVAIRNSSYFGNYEKLSLDDYLAFSTSSLPFKYDEKMLKDANNILIAAEPAGYSWEEILKSQKPQFSSSIEKKGNFEFSGKIASPYQQKLTYSVTIPGNRSEFYFEETNIDGTFLFALPSYAGKKTIILKARPLEGSNENFDYNLTRVEIPAPKAEPLIPTAAQLIYARESKENKAVQRVYGTNMIVNTPPVERSSNYFSILSIMEDSIKLTDYTALTSMQEIATELLEGVRIREKKDGSFKIQMRNKDEFTGHFTEFNEEEPLRLIDGLPIYDSRLIGQLNPLDVDLIEMRYGIFELNGVEFKGILHIHTVEKNYPELYSGNHLIVENPGYEQPRIFKTPEHRSVKSRTPDFRPLLYWNPKILVDKNGVVKIEFYASDDIDKYTIDIQGLRPNGEPIVAQKSFSILENN